MSEREQSAKKKTWLWALLILLVAVAGNGVAYVVWHRTRPPKVQPPPALATPAPTEDPNDGLARARRAAGLAALERHDYDKATAEFSEALRLRKEEGDLRALLAIADDLRAREAERAAQPAKPLEPGAPASIKPPPSRRKGAPLAARAEPLPPPALEAPRNGLLLVTSTPPGMVVMVDGKPMELTPARLSVPPGIHQVTLALGARRLLEEMVEIGEDDVRTINHEMKAGPAAIAAAPTPPPPAPTPASQPAATDPTGLPAVSHPPTSSTTGDLEIASPALYGEIWINDRPYGFPPVTARGLPAGKARLEVRVQGAVKRRMTVEVEPGRSTPVRVR